MSDHVYEERRAPRGCVGMGAVAAFWIFNAVMAYDLVRVLLIIGEHEREASGIGKLAVQSVGVNRMIEIGIVWAVIGGILGALVLATRGRKTLVRRGAPPPASSG